MDLARTDDVITLVSRLDFRWDPLPPISCLPVEILENTFIYTAHDSYKKHWHTSHPKPSTPSWVNVSYVCRHWRDIALNCQILWTYIPTTSQRWTQELLARSQNAPLKICMIEPTFHIDYAASYVLPIVEQLMNHSQRIQELHLDFFDITRNQECSYQALFKIFHSHLPCLHHLEISNFHLPEGESSKENIPALRTLMLGHCQIPWTSLELSALTTLHLDSAEFPFPKIIIMSEFLAVLRRMPHLVQLFVYGSTLRTADEFLSSGEFNAAPTINLSRLSNMTIEAPVSTVNALLSCVDIPLTSIVELGCGIYQSAWQDDVTRLTSLLAQRINPSYDPTSAATLNFRSLTINNNTLKQATLAFSMSELISSSVFSQQSDENTRLLVDIDIFVNKSSRPRAISSHMCRSMMPLTSIRSVHFIGSITARPLLNFWRDMLASFPNVRHIKLTKYHMPQIASMLSLPSHDCSGDKDGPVDGGGNEIFVPALEELELYNITFSRGDSDLKTLCEAISTRKGTQCRLAVKECRMKVDSGVYEALELVGYWEDDQFKVTHL